MLRRQVGNPSSGQVTDAFLNQIINIAYKAMMERFRFKSNKKTYAFSTVVGTQLYDLPTDALALLRVRNTTQNYEGKLEKYGDRRVAELNNVETYGTPLYYARYQNQLGLYPTPDIVYTMEIRYKAVLADLAADTDVPDMPDGWHWGLVLFARYYYFVDQNETAKAIESANFYKDWLSTKPDEVDEEKDDFDSGVSVPTLDGNSIAPRLDFDHSD